MFRGFIAFVGTAIISITASYGFLKHPLVYFIIILGTVALIAPMIMWKDYEQVLKSPEYYYYQRNSEHGLQNAYWDPEGDAKKKSEKEAEEKSEKDLS